MKIRWKVILGNMAFAVIVFATACNGQSKKANTETKQKTETEIAQTQYTCPMHPEVIQNEPGNCPECGMTLEEKEKASAMEHQHGGHTHE